MAVVAQMVAVIDGTGRAIMGCTFKQGTVLEESPRRLSYFVRKTVKLPHDCRTGFPYPRRRLARSQTAVRPVECPGNVPDCVKSPRWR